MSEEISLVDARIVDLPIRRPHRIGVMEMRGQSCVVVRVRTADGLTGLGEGVVPGGGPGWGGESVESITVTIDAHLAPALCAGRVRGVNDAVQRMHAVSAANHFTKAAIEMAMWDIAGKRLGQPVHQLLGGLQRDAIDVLWSLGANTPSLFGEAQQFIAEGNKTIKYMMGGCSPRLRSSGSPQYWRSCRRGRPTGRRQRQVGRALGAALAPGPGRGRHRDRRAAGARLEPGGDVPAHRGHPGPG